MMLIICDKHVIKLKIEYLTLSGVLVTFQKKIKKSKKKSLDSKIKFFWVIHMQVFQKCQNF